MYLEREGGAEGIVVTYEVDLVLLLESAGILSLISRVEGSD